jgi:hypothetical protein
MSQRVNGSSSPMTTYYTTPVATVPPPKPNNTQNTLRIVGCAIVIAVSIWSAYVINTNPYTYQTRFWMYFLLGLLTYIVLLMIDDALKIRIIETTQYGFLLLTLVFNVVILASTYTSTGISMTPTTEFINASVFLIGLATLHSLYVIVQTSRKYEHTTAAPSDTPASSIIAAAPQVCTLPPAPSVGSTPQVIDNDKYDEIFEQIYSEGYQDALAVAAQQQQQQQRAPRIARPQSPQNQTQIRQTSPRPA